MSKSKSRTPRTSKSSAPKSKKAPKLPEPDVTLAVGHEPASQLAPQDEKLFRAFQSNLLSLISHELRTPLMGVLNSLSLLEEDPKGEMGISREELVKMARQNADRLNRTLSALLDLAQLESGVFHARLREIDFVKTLRTRLDQAGKALRDASLKTDFQVKEETSTASILADPRKVSRAVDLSLQAIIPRAVPDSTIRISVGEAEAEFRFRIKPEALSLWKQAWLQAQAGFQGGVASPSSAFGGVLQSEEAFLTRQEEGLGSEFLLLHEIMRLHHGSFTEKGGEGDEISLLLTFSPLTSEQGIRAVLTSRAYDVSTELGSVALVLMESPSFKSREGEVERFVGVLKQHLFRATDAVYPLPDRNQVALVLDDCKAEDIPGLLGRLKKSLVGSSEADDGLRLGWAHCPSDSLDPSRLFDLASNALGRS